LDDAGKAFLSTKELATAKVDSGIVRDEQFL